MQGRRLTVGARASCSGRYPHEAGEVGLRVQLKVRMAVAKRPSLPAQR